MDTFLATELPQARNLPHAMAWLVRWKGVIPVAYSSLVEGAEAHRHDRSKKSTFELSSPRLKNEECVWVCVCKSIRVCLCLCVCLCIFLCVQAHMYVHVDARG